MKYYAYKILCVEILRRQIKMCIKYYAKIINGIITLKSNVILKK